MNANAFPHGFSHLDDVLGQLPMIKRYTLLSLFFRLDDSASVQDVESQLRQGLKRLSTALPSLKGRVAFEGKTEKNWGRRRIVPFEETIHLVVKDQRDNPQVPSFEDFSNAKFPFSMLDPEVLMPVQILPEPYAGAIAYQDTAERPARVLVVQATFLEGGLALAFMSNHTTTDMNGLGQIICFFAKACRDEPFSEEEMQIANQDRRNAMPLLGDDYQPGAEAKYFTFRPPPPLSSPPSPPTWQYFGFSADSIASLKKRASEQQLVPYITTNDAISAFFWQHITRARSHRLGPDISTEINRQISARRILGLPSGYLGHMTTSTHNHEVDVYKQPFDDVTAKLRQKLNDTDTIRHEIRGMATMLERVEDKTSIGYGTSLDWDKDVVLSSYAEIQVCQVSFGSLLGVPIAARRPRASPAPGLVYLMPKDPKGDMAAAVCLREDDMEKLRADEEFLRCAEWIG